MMSQPFLDYYTNKGIIPTRQDITDLAKHFRRRKALYRHLGIPSSFLNGASVIEFGPGTGHNALFTAHCQPKTYVLVDAMPDSLKSTSIQLIPRYGTDHIQIIQSDILSFKTDKKFDLVLCEGVIPTQKDPNSFLQHVASFVRPGGLVITTCMDSIALFPEILRRYVARLIIQDITDFSLQVKSLTSFFYKDLTSLHGMSRCFEDWVIDQILHPWIGPLFSIPEAIDSLSHDFEIYATSPHFITDWRWYKTIHDVTFGFNEGAKKCYFSEAHSFIDYRFVCAARAPELNIALQNICNSIYERVFANERGECEYPIHELVKDLSFLEDKIEGCHVETREAISDFRICIQRDINAFNSFRNLWGRGQQYISFIKND